MNEEVRQYIAHLMTSNPGMTAEEATRVVYSAIQSGQLTGGELAHEGTRNMSMYGAPSQTFGTPQTPRTPQGPGLMNYIPEEQGYDMSNFVTESIVGRKAPPSASIWNDGVHNAYLKARKKELEDHFGINVTF